MSVLELEAEHIAGVFGSSLGAYGFLRDNRNIAEVDVQTRTALEAHIQYLKENHLPYKVDGKPFGGANW